MKWPTPFKFNQMEFAIFIEFEGLSMPIFIQIQEKRPPSCKQWEEKMSKPGNEGGWDAKTLNDEDVVEPALFFFSPLNYFDPLP